MRRSSLVLIAAMALLLGACDTLFEPVEPSTPDPLVVEEETQLPTAEPDLGATEGAASTEEGESEKAAAESEPASDAEAAAGSGEGAAMESRAGDVGPPLPYDMLSGEEMDRAIALALDTQVVADAVGAAVDRDAVGAGQVAALAELSGAPSYRVVYVQRWPDKDATGRAAEVLVYRYDTGQTIVTRVDLENGDTEVVDVPVAYPVPVSPAEIAESAALARTDARVREALEDAGLDPEAASATGILSRSLEPQSRCEAHRCLRLFFLSLRAPTPTFSVVFDTVDMEVVEVEPMPERSQP